MSLAWRIGVVPWRLTISRCSSTPCATCSVNGMLRSFAAVEAVAQQVVGAVLDLHRRDHAGEHAGRVFCQPVDQRERRLQTLAAARLVPVEAERMIVGELPARAGEARRHEAANAALADDVGPALVDRRDVAHRRDAALEHLAQRDFQAGAAQLRIGHVERLAALVQARHVHVGDAVLLADAAIGRLVAEMRMDVDQARHHHQAAAVDGRVRRSGEARPDMGDARRRRTRRRCPCGRRGASRRRPRRSPSRHS